MRKNIVISIAFFIFSIVVIGCSALTPPMEKPIIEDHAHARDRITTLTTIPSRRVVIIRIDDQKSENSKEKVFICSEASPDVTDDLTSTLAAALAAEKANVGELSASMAKTLESTSKNLFKRTQGLQLYRDGMYHLCIATMNGVIDDKTYWQKAMELLDVSAGLIKEELSSLKQVSDETISDEKQSSVPPITLKPGEVRIGESALSVDDKDKQNK